MKMMKVGELILDYDLYPRTQTDSSHLRYMLIALEGGAKFPPIVADRKSKRVTDGFHRTKMYQRHDPNCKSKSS